MQTLFDTPPKAEQIKYEGLVNPKVQVDEMYACPHCGTPTEGRVIGMMGKKVIREMCQECSDYIGSPAAQQEGATMNNRREMEKKLKEAGG